MWFDLAAIPGCQPKRCGYFKYFLFIDVRYLQDEIN